ncbi:hypothetical protein HWV62_2091 [Athelia sp. TMB]|nr:hypothetical protein HWV62_2091 [Athelia sp. TMB]
MDNWRIALLGDGNVGKTALAVQFVLNRFVGESNTLATNHYNHLIPILQRVVALTLSQTYDPTIEDAYRKQLVVDNKMCFLEIIDTAGQETFRQSMLRVKTSKPVFMLIGNKCDMVGDRAVSKEEGLSLARVFGCNFMETSAKTNLNVERTFMSMIRALRDFKKIPDSPRTPPATRGEKLKKQKSRKCCIL